MKNKLFYRFLDLAIGISLASFAILEIQRVVINFEDYPWYRATLVIAGFLFIAIAMMRYASYPLRLLNAEKIAKIQEHVIEDGMAHQAAIEEGLYQAIALFTPEQVDEYYKNLKELD